MEDPVEIRLTESGVMIASVGTRGIDDSYELWDGITATEHFAAGSDTGAYVLSLRKSPQTDVQDVVQEVKDVDRELMTGLHAVPSLRRLLGYHQSACVGYYGRARLDRSDWFIDLYKVRDLLTRIYRTERAVREELGIDASDWRYFGRLLNNNDLRHAELRDVTPNISRSDIRRLYGLARQWTTNHLRKLGLPAL